MCECACVILTRIAYFNTSMCECACPILIRTTCDFFFWIPGARHIAAFRVSLSPPFLLCLCSHAVLPCKVQFSSFCFLQFPTHSCSALAHMLYCRVFPCICRVFFYFFYLQVFPLALLASALPHNPPPLVLLTLIALVPSPFSPYSISQWR